MTRYRIHFDGLEPIMLTIDTLDLWLAAGNGIQVYAITRIERVDT